MSVGYNNMLERRFVFHPEETLSSETQHKVKTTVFNFETNISF